MTETEEHPLARTFTLWYEKQEATDESWDNRVVKLCTISTVEQFWQMYSHLTRLHTHTRTETLSFFEQGIHPSWEDPRNQEGFKTALTFVNESLDYQLEQILLNLVGNSLMYRDRDQEINVSELINGVIIKIRKGSPSIEVWSRPYPNSNTIMTRCLTNLWGQQFTKKLHSKPLPKLTPQKGQKKNEDKHAQNKEEAD
ncbi:putative Eukaryotic translation initiation factor NCBP [Blattamonas nauphoetae]|uniref:Eukaryotic translation initiation factor NCBP n=1 Tax=Blattamonas nauphoetae TaxID=2049346 RepID=A0ABQ9X9C7_9EUKA|nr:putative Eukaryotic translation initiation factor NCBP [Blattamonas nauphoetae]